MAFTSTQWQAFSELNRQRSQSPAGFNHKLRTWTTDEWLCATLGELGEAANVHKKVLRHRDGVSNAGDPTLAELMGMFRDEVADTLIYVDLLSSAHHGYTRWPVDTAFKGVPGSYQTNDIAERLREVGVALFRENEPHIGDAFVGLFDLADTAGFDLADAVRDKFDRTSAKLPGWAVMLSDMT